MCNSNCLTPVSPPTDTTVSVSGSESGTSLLGSFFFSFFLPSAEGSRCEITGLPESERFELELRLLSSCEMKRHRRLGALCLSSRGYLSPSEAGFVLWGCFYLQPPAGTASLQQPTPPLCRKHLPSHSHCCPGNGRKSSRRLWKSDNVKVFVMGVRKKIKNNFLARWHLAAWLNWFQLSRGFCTWIVNVCVKSVRSKRGGRFQRDAAFRVTYLWCKIFCVERGVGGSKWVKNSLERCDDTSSWSA